DQAVAIIFCTPFIVAALGGPMLGEWIGWRRWIAILVGFAGVLLVTRPGAGGIHPAALLVVGSAICYPVYSLATPLLARHLLHAAASLALSPGGGVCRAPGGRTRGSWCCGAGWCCAAFWLFPCAPPPPGAPPPRCSRRSSTPRSSG